MHTEKPAGDAVYPGPGADTWGPRVGVRGAWGVVQDSNGAKQGHK